MKAVVRRGLLEAVTPELCSENEWDLERKAFLVLREEP